MGGKRPDQYQIDPAEGRTTDHKFNPQSSRGDASDLTEMRARDKQQLEDTKSGGQPFLPNIPSPSAEAHRAARQNVNEEEEDISAEEAEMRGKENP